MNQTANKVESNIGMTLTFTQACAGDVVKIADAQFFVSQKCPSGHFVKLIPLDKNKQQLPQTMSEYAFNQAKPVLVQEGMVINERRK